MSSEEAPLVSVWTRPPYFFYVHLHDNLVDGVAAPAHVHGDNAHLSLPWLIAVHVTSSEAPPPLYLPSANLHPIMSICAET